MSAHHLTTDRSPSPATLASTRTAADAPPDDADRPSRSAGSNRPLEQQPAEQRPVPHQPTREMTPDYYLG